MKARGAKIAVLLTFLLMLPLFAQAQSPVHFPVQSYLFAAPGATSPATLHLGGGVEVFVTKSIGLGGEAGYVAPISNFADWASGGLGMGSANVSYHFLPGLTHPKLEPFVTAGYTAFAHHGVGNGGNFGAGANIWLKERAALRLEVRDHVTAGGDISPVGEHQFVEFRVGATFK